MKTVVVGVADTETARRAAHEAADLARALGAALHIVSAVSKRGVQTVSGGGEEWTFTDMDLAETHLKGVELAVGEGIEVTRAVLYDDPAKAIVAEAERLDADVIVVGSVRTSGPGRVLGSVAGDVLKSAPCAIHVAKTT
ncbi:MAG: universal stress protein [Acidimicrobiia bacterium]